MDFWESLSMAGPGLAAFAALASALFAFVTYRNARRRDRARLYLEATHTASGEIELIVHNRGASAPIVVEYAGLRSDNNRGGTLVNPPAPGDKSRFPLPAVAAQIGSYIEVSWINQDGSRKRIRRWYRETGDMARDQRNDLASLGKFLRKASRQNRFDRRRPRQETTPTSPPTARPGKVDKPPAGTQ